MGTGTPGVDAAFVEASTRTERRVELDIGKGMAVFLMVCVHVQEMYSMPTVQRSFFGYAVEFLTTFPAAPLFMLAMGIGAVYSRNQDAAYAFSRGGVLLLTGYLLNAIRGYVPWVLGLATGLLPAEAIPYGNVLLSLLEVDILQLAGLSLILIGGLRALKAPWGAYPVVAVLLGAVNYLVYGTKTGNTIVDSLLGLFWGTGDTSYFPFLCWAFYPLVGVAFGTLLRRSEDKSRFYLYSLLAACMAFFVSLRLAGFRGLHYLGIPEAYAYYHHDLVGNIYICSLTIIWLSALYFLRGAFPVVIVERLRIWSRSLTRIYLAHWVIIGWLALLVGFNRMSYSYTLLAMAALVVVSDRVATTDTSFASRMKLLPKPRKGLNA